MHTAKKPIRLTYGTLVLVLGLAIACGKDMHAPIDAPDDTDTPYPFRVPPFFPEPVDMPDNPMTKNGVALGRRLFYEPLLSANKLVSCATCHHQDKAFSDGLTLSNTGVTGAPLERHSPVLFNLAWSGNGLFWDGGSTNLESQALGPLTHPDEMGILLPEMAARLAADDRYIDLFRRAFGEPPSTAGVVKALAQFQRTLVSANSRYDVYRRGEDPGALNAIELEGLQLVQQKCGSCHAGALFTDNRYHNNGIDDEFNDHSHEEIYLGRYRITRDEHDLGAFRTPSLRNVMVTAPYMHDGRFASIEDVLDHYQNGVKPGPYTDDALYQSGNRPGIPMTEADILAIKSFLTTLTDESFLNAEKYANPFD